MSSPTILWYFADPMCSWCWGFSTVMDQIKAHYGDDLKVALMMGGLRPGTTEPMTAVLRDEILHHWHQVNKLTGQEFTFEGAMPDGFIYDTEPASRAVIAVSELHPESTLAFLKKVQHAFYVDQKDVADINELADLTESFPVDRQQFINKFNSEELIQKTQLHFQHTRQAEVRGFPCLIMNTGSDFKKISSGYVPFESARESIDSWIAAHEMQTDE